MSKSIDGKPQPEWMNRYEVEMLKTYASKVIEKLKLELSLRSNNDHVGTGFGGNPSQFLFIISQKIDVQKSPDGQPHFLEGPPGWIVFQLERPVTMVAVRKAFDSFFASHPERNDFTMEQVSNPSFLRDHVKSPSINVQLLIKALEIGRELASLLDQKGEVLSVISKSFDKEIKALQVCCLKDLGFPLDSIKDDEEKDQKDIVSSKLRAVCRKHPVWGARIKEVQKREEKIAELMLSQEDLDKLNTMGSFPNYIAMFSVRTSIQIDRLVRFNLDERTTFLNEINKVVESSLDKDEE